MSLSEPIPHYLSASASDGEHHILHSYANQISTRESFRLETGIDPVNGRMGLLSASATDPSSIVDVSGLAAAAEKYKISADINDYVLAEVPIVEGDVPNRNMHCFLTSRLLEWLPEYGMQAYKTFVGKPVFMEHKHDIIEAAKGIILDARMHVHNNRSYVMILKAFDRTKDRNLAEAVLSGKRRGHSMSAWAGEFDCAACGHRWNTQYQNSCECVRGDPGAQVNNRYVGMGRITADGRLIYVAPAKFRYFESSSVEDPANFGAHQVAQNPWG
jgi:hypothetical protein